MGHRLHVAKKYDIEYSSIENFNREVEEFHDLLTALDITYSGDECDDDFEVNKEEWQEGIEKLKNLGEQIDEEKIRKALDRLNEDLPETITYMQLFLDKSYQDDDFMHLSFY